jgi:hypothetical protein
MDSSSGCATTNKTLIFPPSAVSEKKGKKTEGSGLTQNVAHICITQKTSLHRFISHLHKTKHTTLKSTGSQSSGIVDMNWTTHLEHEAAASVAMQGNAAKGRRTAPARRSPMQALPPTLCRYQTILCREEHEQSSKEAAICHPKPHSQTPDSSSATRSLTLTDMANSHWQ